MLCTGLPRAQRHLVDLALLALTEGSRATLLPLFWSKRQACAAERLWSSCEAGDEDLCALPLPDRRRALRKHLRPGPRLQLIEHG